MNTEEDTMNWEVILKMPIYDLKGQLNSVLEFLNSDEPARVKVQFAIGYIEGMLKNIDEE